MAWLPLLNPEDVTQAVFVVKGETGKGTKLEMSDSADISRTFSRVILPAKRREMQQGGAGKRRKIGGVDREHFIPYKPADVHSEAG